ncbi:MAG: hypothetical protein M0P31_17720 [Solirubrobacteraceae bacterium]|nr:hypothetical protein [Solirubrobacteraceae bacterium]
MSRAAALLLMIAGGLSATGCASTDTTPSDPTTITGTSTVASRRASRVAAPRLSPEAIQRQVPPRGERRRAERAMTERPLLSRLPLRADGITVDIAGLDRDGHTTVLTVTGPGRSTSDLQAWFERLLRDHGDNGRGYRVRFYGTR